MIQRTHCLRGHELSGRNLLLLTRGDRVCRTCRDIRKQNAKEGKRTIRARQTHCENGHEFTPENTYLIVMNGYECQRCRTCASKRMRGYYRNNPNKFTARAKSYNIPNRKGLKDQYIVDLLRLSGIPRDVSRANPELIEAMRQRIKLLRLVNVKKSETN